MQVEAPQSAFQRQLDRDGGQVARHKGPAAKRPRPMFRVSPRPARSVVVVQHGYASVTQRGVAVAQSAQLPVPVRERSRSWAALAACARLGWRMGTGALGRSGPSRSGRWVSCELDGCDRHGQRRIRIGRSRGRAAEDEGQGAGWAGPATDRARARSGSAGWRHPGEQDAEARIDLQLAARLDRPGRSGRAERGAWGGRSIVASWGRNRSSWARSRR